jgi:hypothetical protein
METVLVSFLEHLRNKRWDSRQGQWKRKSSWSLWLFGLGCNSCSVQLIIMRALQFSFQSNTSLNSIHLTITIFVPYYYLQYQYFYKDFLANNMDDRSEWPTTREKDLNVPVVHAYSTYAVSERKWDRRPWTSGATVLSWDWTDGVRTCLRNPRCLRYHKISYSTWYYCSLKIVS